MTTIVNNGISDEKEMSHSYFPYQVWDVMNKGGEYGVGAPYINLIVSEFSLLVGIDPVQEAKLVGLDQAIIDKGSSRYFDDADTYHMIEDKYGDFHEFPIIVNQNTFIDKVEEITFERLDIAIHDENANEIMEDVKDKGGKSYLDAIEGKVVETFSYTGEEIFQTFVGNMTGIDWKTGEAIVSKEKEITADSSWMEVNDDATFIVFKPSPLEYKEMTSPYADRWPYAYQVTPFQPSEDADGDHENKQTLREPNYFASNFTDFPHMKPNWIGFYDASNLAISKDPTTELPMETYRPASAEFVMDAEGNPINPPKQLKPTGDPYGFLTDPPGMLTTIEAAEQLLGDQPISAIRVKVAGITDMSDESEIILERIAEEIENKTGLITDITLGSSPQLALTFVPGLNGNEDIGWLQQPWVNIGSSISIFREAKDSFSGVVASVIAVAVVYVWASGIVHLLARRKEFAVLLSIGWRPGQLGRLLILESTIIGLFVAFISWLMLSFVYISSDTTVTFSRFLWTGLFGLIIYMLGTIIPIILTRTISPYEAMRTGEISSKSKRLFQAKGINRMAFNHFIGKWKRSMLSVISIALPTALLAVFLLITFRLKGILYTSLLGEYIAVEVGPAHYVAIIISLIIAILTTAEIMWQNVSERKEEISLLQALGWKRWSIRRLILIEGVFSGLFAAFIGLTIAFLMMFTLYDSFPKKEVGFILATGIIPIVIGVIGTIIPAERAVRMTSNKGMGGSISNRKSVEKRIKLVFIATSILLIATFLFAMVKIAPHFETVNENHAAEETISPTEGNKDNNTDLNNPEQSTGSNETTVEYDTPGKYELEFNSDQTSNDTSWGNILFYTAKEIENTKVEVESGMKNISIEFTFEILDTFAYEMQPKQNFSIVIDNEKYIPNKVTIIESEAWEEEKWLNGYKDGKMQAVLEFTVPEDVETYGLFFENDTVGRGFMINFNEE